MLAQMDGLIIVSRWIHIFSVIIAVGGTVFLRLVLHPVAKATIPPEVGSQFSPALIRRWAHVVHSCILFIILSGTYNTIVQFPLHKGQPVYHAIWGVKILLALGLFFIAIAITGSSPAFEGMRKKRPKWMAVNILLAAIIVLLSNILKNLPTGS
jgi:uncharacterized membrane protein